MRKRVSFIAGSLLGCNILYFLLRYLAGEFGFIHDGYEEISIWGTIIIFYIAYCVSLIIDKLNSSELSDGYR